MRYGRKQVLALAIAIALSCCGAQAFAAQGAGQLMQASGQVALYQGANNGTGIVATLEKGAVMLAYESSGSFTRIMRNTQVGYVASGKLKAPDTSATLIGFVVAKKDAPIYEQPGGEGKKLGTLQAGEAAGAYLRLDGYVAIVYGKTIGFVQEQRLTQVAGTHACIGYVHIPASTRLSNSTSSSSGRIGSIAAGELPEQLYAGNGFAIVRVGTALGIVSTANTAIYTAQTPAAAIVQATSTTKLYVGPGNNYAQRGALQKNETADSLGAYKNYTIVRTSDGIIGLAQSSALHAAETAESTGAAYLYAPKDAYVYSAAGTQYKTSNKLRAGTAVSVLETKSDWVKMEVAGLKGWMRRADLQECPAVPILSISGYSSANYSQESLALIACINAYRTQRGQKELKADPVLMKAAEIRASELTQLFGHTRPNGLGVNTLDIRIASENIARGIGPTSLATAELAADAFMQSSEHKTNAMNGSFTKTGAAYYRIGDAKYWVQLFS